MLPSNVREGRSEGLKTFIKDILSKTNNALQLNENETKNFSKEERDLFNLLANDKNIIIKPRQLWAQTIMKKLSLIP